MSDTVVNAERTGVAGPFDEFLYQTDAADDGDFLASRVFDRGVDVAPFLRQAGTLPYTDDASRKVWLDAQMKPILDRLQDVRKCVYCNAAYKLIDNFGTWQCSWHPQRTDHQDIYLCCGREAPTNGCRPCDHSSVVTSKQGRWTESNRLIDIPMAIVNILRPQIESYAFKGINPVNPARSLYRLNRAKV